MRGSQGKGTKRGEKMPFLPHSESLKSPIFIPWPAAPATWSYPKTSTIEKIGELEEGVKKVTQIRAQRDSKISIMTIICMVIGTAVSCLKSELLSLWRNPVHGVLDSWLIR
jgi:hypothetical protein